MFPPPFSTCLGTLPIQGVRRAMFVFKTNPLSFFKKGITSAQNGHFFKGVRRRANPLDDVKRGLARRASPLWTFENRQASPLLTFQKGLARPTSEPLCYCVRGFARRASPLNRITSGFHHAFYHVLGGSLVERAPWFESPPGFIMQKI